MCILHLILLCWSFSFRLSIRSIRNSLSLKSLPSTIHCNLGILYFLRYRILGCNVVLTIVHNLWGTLCFHSIEDWCQIYILYLLCAKIFQKFLRSLEVLFAPTLTEKSICIVCSSDIKLIRWIYQNPYRSQWTLKSIPLHGSQLPPQSSPVSSPFFSPSVQCNTITFSQYVKLRQVIWSSQNKINCL